MGLICSFWGRAGARLETRYRVRGESAYPGRLSEGSLAEPGPLQLQLGNQRPRLCHPPHPTEPGRAF